MTHYKTIRLTAEVYVKLLNLRHPGESLSRTVDRLLGVAELANDFAHQTIQTLLFHLAKDPMEQEWK